MFKNRSDGTMGNQQRSPFSEKMGNVQRLPKSPKTSVMEKVGFICNDTYKWRETLIEKI